MAFGFEPSRGINGDRAIQSSQTFSNRFIGFSRLKETEIFHMNNLCN
jgi:hypothetical protein